MFRVRIGWPACLFIPLWLLRNYLTNRNRCLVLKKR